MVKINPVTGKFIRWRKLPAEVEARLNERMPWPAEYPYEGRHHMSPIAYFNEPEFDVVRPRKAAKVQYSNGFVASGFLHYPA